MLSRRGTPFSSRGRRRRRESRRVGGSQLSQLITVVVGALGQKNTLVSPSFSSTSLAGKKVGTTRTEVILSVLPRIGN